MKIILLILLLASCTKEPDFSPEVTFRVTNINSNVNVFVNDEPALKLDDSTYLAILNDFLEIDNTTEQPTVKILKVGRVERIKTVKHLYYNNTVFYYKLN